LGRWLLTGIGLSGVSTTAPAAEFNKYRGK